MLIADIAASRILRAAGRPWFPLLATFNVTARCNCRCAFCDIHSMNSDGELSTSELTAVLGDPLFSRLHVLRVTGGEPFLRDDIDDILDTARAHTPVRIFHVTTNASMSDRLAELLRRAAPHSRPQIRVQISIDALGALHDEMRGFPGLFDRAAAALREIRPLLNGNISAGVNQTVSAENLDQIEPVRELARAHGADHNVILAAKFHEGTRGARIGDGKNELPFLPLKPLANDEIDEFYRLADARAANSTPRALSSLLRETADRYLRDGGRNRLLRGAASPRPPCSAMFNHLRLLHDGRVVACTALTDTPAGSVREASISQIWRSPRADSLRAAVKRCPGCWVECDISPSAFLTGDAAAWALKKIISEPRFAKTAARAALNAIRK